MPSRGPFTRLLLGVGILCAVCAVVLAIVGGVVLHGSGVIAVVLAGAVSACLAVGIARETPGATPKPPVEAAAQAAAWTIGALLVLAGAAALGGGIAAVLLGAAGAIAALGVWLLRHPWSATAAAGQAAPAESARPVSPPVAPAPWYGISATAAGRSDATGAARLSAPVSELRTAALGQEWLRTAAALAARLEPAARESLVRLRQEALDELERRDPEGFARWLATGPLPGSDPADYVRGNPSGGRGA